MNTELFFPYISHKKIELVEATHINTYRHLQRLLTNHPHLFDYESKPLPNTSYSVFFMDNLGLKSFPVVASLSNGTLIREKFLIYALSDSRHSKGWLRGLTKEEALKACSNIEFVDLLGNSRGASYLTSALTEYCDRNQII